MRTGQKPIRNSSGRPVIAPQKQILAFRWRIANQHDQEPARAVADRLLATVSLCGPNGQMVSHDNQIREPFSLSYLKPGSKGRD